MLPSSCSCTFLPNSRAFSGLIPSPSLLMNPVQKHMKIFCALILSNGSISSSQLLTPAIAFSSVNLCARSRWVAVDATLPDKEFIKEKWVNVWTQHPCADSPLRKHPPERLPFDFEVLINVCSMQRSLQIPNHSWLKYLTWLPVVLKLLILTCCSWDPSPYFNHHLDI